MEPRPGDTLFKFSDKISQCCEMLSTIKPISPTKDTTPREPLPSLLEQCDQLTTQVTEKSEPVRTLHHLACTGGTLISKCLACMPNTLLLSEVEPYSQIPGDRQSKFFPTDLIMLLRNSSRGGDPGLEGEVFMAGLAAIYKDCVKRGLRLLLRDHSHSQYCFKRTNSGTPKLRELVGDSYPINVAAFRAGNLRGILRQDHAFPRRPRPPALVQVRGLCRATRDRVGDHVRRPGSRIRREL